MHFVQHMAVSEWTSDTRGQPMCVWYILFFLSFAISLTLLELGLLLLVVEELLDLFLVLLVEVAKAEGGEGGVHFWRFGGREGGGGGG